MNRCTKHLVVVLASAICLFAQTKPAADLIIQNARVWTVDSSHRG